ncbi:MAG: ribosome recycling factor [Faecousia sp.]|nr:ribosome recycling factor [Bacillota bacterium]
MAVDFKEFNRKMDKTLEILQEDFGAIRAGRANARVLDRITVEYYGVDTPIGQVGTISSPDARTLVIQPWDGSLLKKVEKAIQSSDLGINPQNDGRVIRLVFPQLTEERRRELAKQVRKYGEDAKVAVRNIRRDAMDYIKKLKKDSEITEDDQKKAEKDLQELTDKYIKKVDDACAVKEKELMEL